MPNAKKILIKKLPKFESDVYANLSLGDLVVFALSYLEEKEIDANTEEIVSICFRLFPQKFGLKSYPRWPDSALVIRRLNDDREKKNIKGNPAEGFALTFKGKQVAKRAGKLLGIKKKDTPKKKKQKPAPLVLTKKTLRKRFRKPIQAKAVKKKVIVAKKTAVTDRLRAEKKKKVMTKVVTTRKRDLQNRATKSKNVGHAFSVTKKDRKKKGELEIRTTQVKKKLSENKNQVEVKQEAQKVVKGEPVVNISKEEKIKAGKVIHQVEKSDAYKLYKKNGKQAKISEFDFRNMLFATMESSSDTLTRNVALFKKYANMQSRNDVIAFLVFCENSFTKLLKR